MNAIEDILSADLFRDTLTHKEKMALINPPFGGRQGDEPFPADECLKTCPPDEPGTGAINLVAYYQAVRHLGLTRKQEEAFFYLLQSGHMTLEGDIAGYFAPRN